ncbi:MAG: ATP-binding cassette domain-containing protein [Candidatus Paceibacterota bacterium]
MAILEIDNLSKSFGGVRSVDSLSLRITKGTITGIIGPNGTGKTTLMNLISGTLSAETGTIMVDGKIVSNQKPWMIAGAGVVRTFQITRLFEQMTVLDNVLTVMTQKNVFASLFDKKKSHYLERAKNALARVGLLEKDNQLAANLSYGQRRLLEIARVVASDAQIILLDEPFSGLYPAMAQTVAGILKDLKSQGKTIIFIEHNIELARELCDYLFVMPGNQLLPVSEAHLVS